MRVTTFLATITAVTVCNGLWGMILADRAESAPSGCQVDVLIHEDNSYSGLALRQDGAKVAHEWTVTPPARQNTITLRRTPQGALLRVANVDWTSNGPRFRGADCSVVPVRSGR